MGLFSRTRRGHTARIRTFKRLVAVGAGVATLLTGVGLAAASTYTDEPGYKFIGRNAAGGVEDLGILNYKDGRPFYCLEENAGYTTGDENRGTWTKVTDLNDRIASKMVADHEGDRSDFTQAAVAYAIHDHLDQNRGLFLGLVASGLQGADINAVRTRAGQLWADAAAHTPDSAEIKTVEGASKGYFTADIKTQGGGYVSGVPWRLVNIPDGMVIDGPTSGVTGNGPARVNWHAKKAVLAHVHIQYDRAVARRMAAPNGNMQPLFMHDPGVEHPEFGRLFRIAPTYTVKVTTDHQASSLVTGGSAPVHDTLHVSIDKSSADAEVDVRPMTAKVTLHFDGNKGHPAEQSTKDATVRGAGDVQSPDFTPSDLHMGSAWQSGTYYFTIHIDKVANSEMTGPVDTKDHLEREETVAPDKVWVLDSSGALHNSDHTGSNKVDWHNSPDRKAADGETFLPGDPVSAVVNAPVAVKQHLTAFDVEDDWSDAERYVDFAHPEWVKVYYGDDDSGMTDVTDKFTIEVTNSSHTHAIAKPSFLSIASGQTSQKWVKLIITGRFKDTYQTNGRLQELKNGGRLTWNNHGKSTNVPSVFTWTPHPDKAWVLNESVYGEGDSGVQDTTNGHQWKVVIDPSRTNAVGGDRKVYREGDAAGVVINGTVPRGLALRPDISFSDDYSKADYMWDPADTSKWRVFEKDADSEEQSSVNDILSSGRDVTDQFTFSVNGPVLSAAAKPAYEDTLMHLERPRQITVLIPGRINIAQGGGNQKIYRDTGYVRKNTSAGIREHADAGDIYGYQVCRNTVDGKNSEWKENDPLVNSATETAGHGTGSTNTPGICVWVPNSSKGIVAEAQFGGDQHDGQDQSVRPGQNVEYRLHVMDRGIPADQAAYRVRRVVLTDHYDQNVTLNNQTVKIVDNHRHGVTIGKDDYDTTVDAAHHTLTITMHQNVVDQLWAPGATVDLDVIFEGNISKNLPKEPARCTDITNTWEYTVNAGVSKSNTLHNKYCPVPPTKQVTQKDPSIDIDGKRLLLGDPVYYRLNMDARGLLYTQPHDEGPNHQLYRVQRLGMVDDYDERFLKLDDQRIQILQIQPDGSTRDVTGRFNIQDKGGVFYAFAKTVDGINPVTGAHVYGNPQPTDLKAYWKKALDKLNDPYIDQSLLGYKYQIVLPMKVIRVQDGQDVENRVIENIDDVDYYSNWVNNELKRINPRKDVVVNVNDRSVNGRDIYLRHYFLYRLDSSIRPTGLAYPHVTDWSIVDRLDPRYDRYTGQWAVYAARDLYKGEYRVARKGQKIAGTGFDSRTLIHNGVNPLEYKRKDAEAVNDRTQNPDTVLSDDSLFTAAQATDGTVTIAANPSYRAMVSDNEHASGWTAYIQVQRMRVTPRHENMFHEYLNGTDRPSNTVWTRTPDQTPRLRIEKYDVRSGLKAGDRNLPAQALPNAVDGTRIGLLIQNVGKSEIHRLTMSDKTIAGDGIVTWDQGGLDELRRADLKPGQRLTIYGTLRGVSKFHTDRATVHGTPVLPCPTPTPGNRPPSIDKPQNGVSVRFCDSTPIVLHDDWNGKRVPLIPGIPGVPRIPGVPGGLPNTGAAVLGILAVAGVTTGLGVALTARRRRMATGAWMRSPAHTRRL